MHDGSHVLLRKIEEEFDPADTMQALQRLHDSAASGELLTGIFYLQPAKKSFTSLLRLGDAPLATLPEEKIRPGREVLEQIMRELM
jgi:2-oxoglutarate ferredoxin oxidoreductase subunit beta